MSRKPKATPPPDCRWRGRMDRLPDGRIRAELSAEHEAGVLVLFGTRDPEHGGYLVEASIYRPEHLQVTGLKEVLP